MKEDKTMTKKKTPHAQAAPALEIYRILQAHLKDEQITCVLRDLLQIRGNRSFRITIGSLNNLHNIRVVQQKNVQEQTGER